MKSTAVTVFSPQIIGPVAVEPTANLGYDTNPVLLRTESANLMAKNENPGPISHATLTRPEVVATPEETRSIDFLSIGQSQLTTEFLGDCKDDTERLDAINYLLSEARMQALDGDTSFHAATIVQVRGSDGQLRHYLDVNLMQPGGESNERHCAETRAIKHALSEDKNAKVTHVWFMGGTSEDDGKRFSPCGACRQLIHDTRDTDNTLVHMLPLNDGDLKIVPFADSDNITMSNLPPNMVFSKSIGSLFPNKNIHVEDKTAELKDIVKEAYEWMESAKPWPTQSRQQQLEQLIALESLTGPGLYAKISVLLNQALKHTYQLDPEKIEELTSAMVRLSDGSYHMTTLVKSTAQSSTISAEYAAITAAANGNPQAQITDLFYTRYNKADIERLLKDWANNPAQPVAIQMPRGDARMRIQKFSSGYQRLNNPRYANGDKIDLELGARVHVIPPTHPTRHVLPVITLSIRKDLLPYPYLNPKSVKR